MHVERENQFQRGDRVELELEGVPRHGVIASVGWSCSLGDVLVVHFDDNPRGGDADLVVTGEQVPSVRPAA